MLTPRVMDSRFRGSDEWDVRPSSKTDLPTKLIQAHTTSNLSTGVGAPDSPPRLRETSLEPAVKRAMMVVGQTEAYHQRGASIMKQGVLPFQYRTGERGPPV